MAIITSLSQKDALPYFKRMVAEAWSDVQGVPNFLRSLTVPKTTTAKAVDIEVERNFRRVAAEVVPGGSPHLHRSAKSTQRKYVPPYFSDAALLNDLDGYQRVFGDGVGTVSRNDVREMANQLVMEMMKLRNLQERAVEKQISDVFEDGVLTTLDGGIDYKRKSNSIVTNAGTDLWSDAGSDPLDQLLTDATFISTQGNSGAARFNVIMGTEAHQTFMGKDSILKRGDYRYIKLADLGMPQIQTNGAVLHGVVSSGSYQFFIWTYPQYYDLGTKTGDEKDTASYIDPKKYVMLSEDVEIRYWKAGVPTVFGNNRPILGDRPVFNDGWSVHEAISQERQTHKVIVRVAPLVVPVSIDRMVTRKVLS